MNINTIELIEEHFNHNEFLQFMVDELGGWGTGKAKELAEQLGREVVSDNTYNHEYTSHLSGGFQFHILTKKDESAFESDNVIMLVEIHGGGDVRGNYESMKAYKLDKYSCISDFFCDLYYDDTEDEDYFECKD